LIDFEVGKRSLQPDGESKYIFSIPYNFGIAYEKFSKQNIGQAFLNNDLDVSFTNGHIVLGKVAVKELFKTVIDEIVHHLKAIFQWPGLDRCKYLMLVGGFGEYAFYQNAIKEAFTNVCVLIPAEAQTAIIKGAVYFGKNPNEIYSRMCRKTYGQSWNERFNPQKHNEKYK
jgi:hypothetical protein